MNSYGVALSNLGTLLGTLGKPELVSLICDFLLTGFVLVSDFDWTGLDVDFSWTGLLPVFWLADLEGTSCIFGPGLCASFDFCG